MNSIDKIKERYQKLTKSEKKIADYIFSNQHRVVHSTMNDLSQLLGVGDATIMRFCKKLDYNGFTDLKISIAKDNIHATKESFNNFSLLNTINDSLSRTHQLIDEENFNNAVTLIRNAKNISIFGKGQSGMSAEDFQKLLLGIGVHATTFVDSDFQYNAAASLQEDDLLIVFSLTGRTADLIDAINIAKNKSSKIIGITNYLLSPIAKLSDIVLQSSYDEFISSPIPGRVSQMYISGLLVELYENNYQSDDFFTIRETTLRTIIKKRVDE